MICDLAIIPPVAAPARILVVDDDDVADGAGTGLAIVQAEARRHGGDLVLSVSDLGGLRAKVTVQAA